MLGNSKKVNYRKAQSKMMMMMMMMMMMIIIIIIILKSGGNDNNNRECWVEFKMVAQKRKSFCH
jgi:uncharacterized membrane-anchored protein